MADILAVNGPLRRNLRRAPHAAVARGLPPRMLGYRWFNKTELTAESAAAVGGRYTVLEEARTEDHPLPVNVVSQSVLPDDAGWWGYAFSDVPARRSGETALVNLPNATLAFATDGAGDFAPGLMARDGTALSLREIDLRGHHAPQLRERRRTAMDRPVWIWERVFDNYSHWLSAHLTKLCLLKDLELLDRLVVPPKRPGFIDDSLRAFGIEPEACEVVPLDRPLAAAELTLLVTDRFRPSRLRAARAAMLIPFDGAPDKKVYVSRRSARARKLRNEAEVWPLFRDAGYERIEMEGLTFAEQRALMGRTKALAGPHGAGLTNQLFCPAGASVLEIADLGFPNPNFYALAAGLGHRYAIVDADPVGDAPINFRDMNVDPAAVEEALLALGE